MVAGGSLVWAWVKMLKELMGLGQVMVVVVALRMVLQFCGMPWRLRTSSEVMMMVFGFAIMVVVSCCDEAGGRVLDVGVAGKVWRCFL